MRRPIHIILIIDLIAILAVVLIYVFTGVQKLGESSFLTKLSGAQLLGISVVSFLIFRVRNRNRGEGKGFSLKNPHMIWALIAAGFFFLMADEMFKIHENIDEMIHSAFGLEETGMSDRIDDLLILLYAFIGLGVIFAYRKEFVLMKKALPTFLCGFGLLFMTVGLDLLTNRDDVINHLFPENLAANLYIWLSIAEECCKVLSEGFFLVAFYLGLQAAKGLASNQS